MKRILKKYIVVTLILAIGFVGALLFYLLRVQDTSSGTVSAKVVGVIDIPNEYENGYYAVVVEDEAGKEYLIDATGYLNTPAYPSDFGEKCENIPKLSVGDKIEFNLPRTDYPDAYKDHSDVFVACYDENISSFYFDLR